MSAGHREESGVREWLLVDKKRFAFRCERISPMSIFLQKFESNQRVHDRPETSVRRASCLTDLLDSFRTVLQCVENFIVNRCSDDQRGRIREAKLHQALGTDLSFLLGFR